VLLELGGKAPQVVLDDANLDDAAAAANFGAFMHQGQICMSTERLIVQKPVVEDFAKKLVAKAEGLQIGDPADPKTQIGSLVSERSVKRVHDLVKDAVERGARVLTGGTPDACYFRRP
jgi:acyl-CoA reductase-like NAD-dependent aldehyde dehydrogenase